MDAAVPLSQGELMRIVNTWPPEAVLDTPMPDNDAGASTIREYLIEVLLAVWRERDCFSGKRPFGKSGWYLDLHGALVRAGAIRGELDQDGFLRTCDDEAGDKLIDEAIMHLRKIR